MFIILIASYVVRNLTIDSYVEKADRIYAISNERYLGTGYWNGQHLKARYPEIEEACGITGGESISVYINNKEHSPKVLFADTTFFEMFSIKLIEGDAKNALISRNNIVISKSFANKTFGTDNPVGRSVVFGEGDNKKERVVVGIMPDIENSFFPESDIITNFLNMEDYNPGITSLEMNNAGATVMFFLEKEGADLLSKTDDIAEFFKTYFWTYKGGSSKEVIFVPFKELYFSDYQSYVTNNGDWTFVIILISVGFLILLFSVANYINLTVAQTGFRAKEMATRRLLGSSRKSLFGKLILESILMTFVAFFIGFALAVSIEPFANDLLQSKISLLKDFDGIYLISYVSLILFVSLISGIIPAAIISNFQPIEVVRGAFRRKTSMIYGKILITFQNIITIALIGGSITMVWQIHHLINAPMGYSYDNIIDVSTWSGFKNYGQIKTAINDLNQLPFVKDVAQSLGTPLDGGNNNTIAYGKERMISFQTIMGDSSFFKMLNLKIKRDNNLAEKSGWYFNEYAFKTMEIDENSLSVKMGEEKDQEIKIAGVFYDFKVRSLLNNATACRLRILDSFDEKSEEELYPWNILVQIDDNYNREEAFNTVKDVLIKASGSTEINMMYIEDQIREAYAGQKRTSDIVLIFTFIAILISSLGLLAMSTYFIQQRRKEIGVRKVFGSTGNEILIRLIGNFMRLVIIAFIISIPIIWYFMSWWLEGYAYRIALSPLIFVCAGIFSTLVAFITVLWQSVIAANQNPVDSISR